MKKTLFVIFTVVSVAFLFMFSSSAVLATTRCTGPNITVSTFEAFKNALENFEDGNTVTLKSNITITDDTKDYGINVKNKGVITVDLNGYTLDVKSAKTKVLFNVTGESKLFFISYVDPEGGFGTTASGMVRFNTKESDAALVKLSNSKAELTNINADFTIGKNYSDSNDGSDSYVFYAEKGSRIDSYKGTISNHMMTGNGIGAAESAENAANLTVRIGGNTTVSAKKHCVVIKPEAVKYVRFGSCRFTSLRDDTSIYERIKTSDSATLKSFWDFNDCKTIIYADSIYTSLNNGKKANAIKKDIDADKSCETITESSHMMLLYYAGGHVELCGTCFMSFDDVAAHTMTITYGRDASCTLDGMEYGQLCTACGYTNANRIPKTGHNLKYYAAKKVACGENGNIAHYKCENQNCGKYFADNKGEKELQFSEVFTVSQHQIVYDEPVAATCTTPGLTSGSHCELCKAVITERKGIPALGHNEVPIGIAVNPTCKYDGKTAGKMCSVCKTVLEEEKVIPKLDHETQIVKGKEATCTEDGLTDGEYCLQCKIMIREQEKIPAKGHQEEILEAKKATCKEEGLTEGKKCSVCGAVTVPQELVAKGAHVVEIIKGKEANCIEEGLTDGSRCAVCKLILEEQKIIAQNDNHDIKVIPGKEATCKETGLTEGKECNLCKEVLLKQEEIPLKSHTEKVIKGKEATCEEEGLSDKVECSVCGEVLEEQIKIEKLPHSEKIVFGKAATCENEGLTDGIECSLCGKTLKKQETIPKSEHILSVSTNRATMQYDGEVVKICTVCKDEISKEVICKIASVEYSKNSYLYDGKKKTPKIYVKNSKGELLKKNVDYKVDYPTGRKNIGKYTATVTFVGSYSGEKSLTFSIIPTKTKKITASCTTNDITLKWTKVNGATGYRVYVYNEKTKKYKALKVTTKTSFKVENLKSGTTYKFALKAYTKTENGNIWAKTYAEISATTVLKTPALKATAGKNQATLSWNKIYNADGYAIYMKEGKNASYKKIGTTKKLTLKKKKLTKGKTYYFKVKAYKKVGDTYIYSPYSTYKTIKIK